MGIHMEGDLVGWRARVQILPPVQPGLCWGLDVE